MKICVQWSTNPANDWVEIDSSDWASIPKKDVPPVDRQPVFRDESGLGSPVVGFFGPEFVINEVPGWICRVCVHGMVMDGDHISIVELEDGIEVACWNDDLADPGSGLPDASVRRFYSDLVDKTFQISSISRMRLQGFRNELDLYIPREKINGFDAPWTTGGQAKVLSYDDFVVPDEYVTRHGVWITNDLLDKHLGFTPSGWRHWVGT